MNSTFSGSIFDNVGILIDGRFSVDQKRYYVQLMITAYCNDESITCDSEAAQHNEITTTLIRDFMDECCKKGIFPQEKDKLEKNDVPNYYTLLPITKEYFCVICQDNCYGGVQLHCAGSNNCLFCKNCITKWLTHYFRCPYCRGIPPYVGSATD
jgi:hypothetical protein